MSTIIISNSDITGHDLLHDTPLGVHYSFLKNDISIQHKIKDFSSNWKSVKPSIVSCSFMTHTDHYRRGRLLLNRKSIEKTLKNNGISNEIIPSDKYYTSMLSSKFVISPEGNGIDCHRHYEALLCGCIPVVEDHPAIREKYSGMPILYTRDYSEITPGYLESKYDEFMKNLRDGKYSFDKLFMEWYSPEKQAEIKKRCNHWIHKRLGIPNYYT